MWFHSRAAKLALRSPLQSRVQGTSRRRLMTLAIETSCDDTSVAVLEKGTLNGVQVARMLFHKKITSNNTEFEGIHPIVTLKSHQDNLANLVNQAIKHLPLSEWGKEVEDDPDQKYELQNAAEMATKRIPDVITVTRGPGMRSNLNIGLELAKGLALAWRKPLVGVHHMQAHALTPRLVNALEACPKAARDDSPSFEDGPGSNTPELPFLSLLVSGGHTLLIHSATLTDHHILGISNDIAIGECLDKIARVVLPAEVLQATRSTMYAALLENFAFGDTWRNELGPQKVGQTPEESQSVEERESRKEEEESWFSALFLCEDAPPMPVRDVSVRTHLKSTAHRYPWYQVPSNHEEAARKSATKWGWGFNQPLTKSGGGTKINSFEMSFSGLLTAVECVAKYGMNPDTKKLNKVERAADDLSTEERKDMAREAMRAAFEHVSSRVLKGLQSLGQISTIRLAVVVAGGVAANSFLRHVLASTLHTNGYDDVELHFPAPEFCTDNAAMIGWTGLEMFEAGHTDRLNIRAVRKWPLDKLMSLPNDGEAREA